MMRASRVVLAASLLSLTFAAPAHAAWSNSPYVNLPICTAANQQYSPTMIPDGAGGAIITWYDYRGGSSSDIYAQHVLASGAVDPAWPGDGRALCTATNYQYYPMIVSDGAGGAIVTWQDNRGGATYDIYAQRVLASGAVDPAWPVDGRALCTAADHQQYPVIAADGAGGAIVTWQDARSGSYSDVYAQHVLASGAVDPAWPANGRALSTAANQQSPTAIIPDGAHGAIIAWYDQRSGTNYDIYAHHVLASGAVDPAWPADGRALCTAAGSQSSPVMVTDGASGALVTWHDARSGSYDIYAHHVLAGGNVDPTWPVDGRALCTAVSEQQVPAIVSDGAGGAIVTWYDDRAANWDIYAQRVLESGAVDPAWPADGRALCTLTNAQMYAAMVSDDAGGAIVVWQDARGGGYWDIYGQHVLSSGVVNPLWPAAGRTLSIAANSQTYPAAVSDGAGGAIVSWYDYRSGTSYDIYAQRVARYAYLGTPEAEIVSAKDVPGDNGGNVKVAWNSSYLEGDPYNLVTYYKVFRSIPPAAAMAAIARGARVSSVENPEGEGVAGDLLATIDGAATTYWEYVALVNVDYLAGYSYPVPTAGDSSGTGNPTTSFMIQARTAGSQHWESQPVSGYSVDNLPPYPPAPFLGTYLAGTASLHWRPNTESDLANYRLYRGTSSAFVPGPANLVAAPTDTAHVDVSGATYYYKLTAIDIHGNESAATLLLPTGALAVEGALPVALSFAPPQPNPARGATTLRFALPREALVRLSIYDTAGRRVRMLVQAARAAGTHAVTWDLRDDGGRAVGVGLYFARLEAEGRAFTQRVMTLR